MSRDDIPAPAVEQDCSDFTAWRDAQDALDLLSDQESLLDDDLDGVACNELGQEEYETAFQEAADDACSFVWQESPDGVLYYDDTGYQQSDCDAAAPVPDEWEASSTGDPESEGATNGWIGRAKTFLPTSALTHSFQGTRSLYPSPTARTLAPRSLTRVGGVFSRG